MTNERTNARHTSKTKVLIEILLPQHKKGDLYDERTNERTLARASRRTPARASEQTHARTSERADERQQTKEQTILIFGNYFLETSRFSGTIFQEICTSYFVLK